jgi:excisionase family DNA binding protein
MPSRLNDATPRWDFEPETEITAYSSPSVVIRVSASRTKRGAPWLVVRRTDSPRAAGGTFLRLARLRPGARRGPSRRSTHRRVRRCARSPGRLADGEPDPTPVVRRDSGALASLRIATAKTSRRVTIRLGMPSHVEATQRLLTRAETAEIARLSLQTLDRLAKSGRLPAVRIGRRVLFDPADIADFIAASKKVAS